MSHFKKTGTIKLFLILVLVLITTETINARAGGGGGGGGGGGYSSGGGGYYGGGRGRGVKWEKGDNERLIIILLIVGVLIAFTFTGYKIIIKYKKNKANRVLQKSAKEDSLWEKEQLITRTEKTYLRMQNAWMKQDMSLVQDIVTEGLYDIYQRILDSQSRVGIYNHIDEVKIEKIEIVGIEDYNDNDYDRFTAYVSGHMVDLIVRSPQQDFHSDKLTYFEDLYHFVRFGNEWLLEGITNNVDIWSVGGLEIKKEKNKA